MKYTLFVNAFFLLKDASLARWSRPGKRHGIVREGLNTFTNDQYCLTVLVRPIVLFNTKLYVSEAMQTTDEI